MKAPSEALLQRVERELRALPKGTQRAVGAGIYLRLDGDGSRRFLFRGAKGLRGGTCASWQDAYEAREAMRAQAETLDRPANELGPEALRRIPLRRYAVEVYWPAMENHLDVSTRFDYRKPLFTFVELAGDLTLADLEDRPLLVESLKRDIAALKRFPEGHRRAGELPRAACDKILKAGSSICEHALDRGAIRRNPFTDIRRFNVQRSRGDGAPGASNRRVKPTEVMHPSTLARVGVGMTGNHVERWERRTIPFLIGTGMRPQDICGSRWFWCRDENGPLPFISVREAVKNLGGHLLPGEPKTGDRDLYQFTAIAELLERLYIAQGCPPLDELIFSNVEGEWLSWGNWRTRVWYPALHQAGISKGDQPAPSARGAFDPYLLRHVGVTTMMHACRHDEGYPAGYSLKEVARQFANSAQTIDRVYSDIPENMHGVAGLTMDEIIRKAWRDVWGPLPGAPDFEDRLLTTVEASALTGVSVNSLGGRFARGTIPAQRKGGRYLVSEFDLRWAGLVPEGDVSDTRE